MPADNTFNVGFSADFLDEQRQPIFPDIGISLLDAEPGISYKFLEEYRPEYVPNQLDDLDVLITMKPRITAGEVRDEY